MTNVPTYMDIYEVNYIIVYKTVKTIALEQYYKQTAVFQVQVIHGIILNRLKYKLNLYLFFANKLIGRRYWQETRNFYIQLN